MEKMKVETISKETIKPLSSPTTPNHVRTLSLSVYDQFLPPIYTVASLFYSNNSTDDPKQSALFSKQSTSLKLKTSLSETLSRFYPFAGTITKGVSIDCNDQGALFLDARLDSTLQDFLKSPDFTTLQQFLPLDVVENPYEAAATWPLLLAKATYFQCGGLAIGLCISHKIADAASISTFIRAWAATCKGDSDVETNPEFAAAKFFPSASYFASFLVKKVEPNRKSSVTKRFVFGASKIDELRSKAASEHVTRPTRVETISALLWKCAIAAAKPRPEKFLPKVLIQPMNLRPKIPSLLSENMIGNALYSSVSLKMDRPGEVNIQESVKELRKKAEELERLIKDDGGSSMMGTKIAGLMFKNFARLSYKTHEPYSVSSWCKLPLYEADFGWGNPVWVAGNVAPAFDNLTVLMDSNDGKGMEAWVTLSEEDMSSFEQNTQLLAFASPNPSVLL